MRSQLCQHLNQGEQNTKKFYRLKNLNQRLVFYSLANSKTENESFFKKVDLFLALFYIV